MLDLKEISAQRAEIYTASGHVALNFPPWEKCPLGKVAVVSTLLFPWKFFSMGNYESLVCYLVGLQTILVG